MNRLPMIFWILLPGVSAPQVVIVLNTIFSGDLYHACVGASVSIWHESGYVFSPGYPMLPSLNKIAKSSLSLEPITFFDRIPVILLAARDIIAWIQHRQLAHTSILSFLCAG